MTWHRLYYWQALTPNGELHAGEHIGARRQEVYDHLLNQGYQPLRLKTGQYLTSGYWRRPQLTAVIRQLATLLQAGLPLLPALNLLAQQHEKPGWRCLLQDVSQRVAQGQPLSEALRQHPQAFPPLCRSLLAVGELTGKLDECCARLAAYQDMQQQLTQKVRQALRYPLFVMLVGFLVSLMMLTLVLPEFARLYAAFDAPLPWLTRGLLALSAAVTGYGTPSGLGVGLLLLVYGQQRQRRPEWKLREQNLWLRLPLAADLIRGHCLSQIFHTLAMTQQAGLPLPAGLSAAAALGHPRYRQALWQIQREIEQGTPLAQALAPAALFPAPCPQLISAGEESGTLDQMFMQLGRWYESQTRQLATALTQALEPLLLMVVGGMVGTLVVAMYLPIFQLGNVLTGI